MGLAGLWSVFGRTLWVGHLAMVPFLVGVVVLAYRIGQYFVGREKAVWVLLLLAVDPFILGQAVLVSPDIPVLFGWLLGIFGVLHRRSVYTLLASVLLVLLSLRGMMLVAVLFLYGCWGHWPPVRPTVRWVWQRMSSYLPAGIIALAFLWGHYQYAGWIGYHADSPWAPSFERVGLMGGIRNVGLLVWRVLDFGRVGATLFIIVGLGMILLGRKKWTASGKALLTLLGLSILVLTPTLVLHQHLSAHRYLMPVTTLLTFLVVYLLGEVVPSKPWRRGIFGAIVVLLLTGNLWVYPTKVAQGWDSTLAHWPYYSLRQKMLDWLETENIPLQQVGTAFPNIGHLRYIDLREGKPGMLPFDLRKHRYIFYSNVFNDLSDADLDELDQHWAVKKRFDRWKISVILYENTTSLHEEKKPERIR